MNFYVEVAKIVLVGYGADARNTGNEMVRTVRIQVWVFRPE